MGRTEDCNNDREHQSQLLTKRIGFPEGTLAIPGSASETTKLVAFAVTLITLPRIASGRNKAAIVLVATRVVIGPAAALKKTMRGKIGKGKEQQTTRVIKIKGKDEITRMRHELMCRRTLTQVPPHLLLIIRVSM
jgi:hypothetical protein